MFLKNILLLCLIQLFFIWGTCNHIAIDIYKQVPRSVYDSVGNTEVNKNLTFETVTLYKFMNAEYYGLIKIGSPAKEFKMVFDTTWGDIFVPSQHCAITEVACMLHTRYDSTASSTYQEDGTPFSNGKSGSFSLSGFFSKDNFHLAHMQIFNQSFIEMTHMSLLPFSYYKADGVIGLAFPSLSTKNKGQFFPNMQKQNLIKQRVFTFYMNKDATTDKAGVLLLGGTDRAHAKTKLTKIPVTGKDYWQFKMDRITVDLHEKSYPFCQNGCDAIIDTSSNEIAGPATEIDKINNLIGAQRISYKYVDRYMINCRNYAKLPNIDFVISDTKFTINSKYYVERLTYKGFEMCLSPFVPSQNPFWELGGAFLMQFYTEYNIDERTIGIAETVF